MPRGVLLTSLNHRQIQESIKRLKKRIRELEELDNKGRV
jgi:hypothetical protein